MGERIRAFDWANHPLGSPEHWPVELQAALGICLNSSFPTAIYWGPQLWLLYNDAWSAVPRDRHPEALGKSGKDLWTDIWDVVGPQFAEVLHDGVGITSYDQMLPIERDGRAEETYWNYSLTPIVDRGGQVVGVFNQGHETTDKVLTARARISCSAVVARCSKWWFSRKNRVKFVVRKLSISRRSSAPAADPTRAQ